MFLRLHLVKKLASLNLVLLAILIGLTGKCFSLEEDSKEKLYIFADSTVINYKTGVKIYEGHVKMDQGTSHITADKVITQENDQRKIKEAIAYGYKTTAHYWTTLKVGDPEMHAYANTIKFYPLTSDVTLETNAYVQQGENSFRGDVVFYNNEKQIITVPPSAKGRAELIYNPNKVQG